MFNKLPIEFKKYFWDVDFEALNISRNYKFILSRILDRGDVWACKWMQQTFTKAQISEALRESTEMSLRSATFWGNIYEVTSAQMRCFPTPYQETRKTLWPEVQTWPYGSLS